MADCHAASNYDATGELQLLFSKARDLYLTEVVKKGMKQNDFIELFCIQHRHIDNADASCRNSHAANLWKVRKAFQGEETLLRADLTKPGFGASDILRMIDHALYPKGNASVPASPYSGQPPLILGCRFSNEEMVALTYIAWHHSIFNAQSREEVRQILESLFRCERGFHVRVANTNKIAIFLDALCSNNRIVGNWQKVMEQGGFLFTKPGNPMTASKLSKAVCRVKGDSSMSGKDGNSLRPKNSHSARINRNYIIYEDVKHYFEEEANKQD